MRRRYRLENPALLRIWEEDLELYRNYMCLSEISPGSCLGRNEFCQNKHKQSAVSSQGRGWE